MHKFSVGQYAFRSADGYIAALNANLSVKIVLCEVLNLNRKHHHALASTIGESIPDL